MISCYSNWENRENTNSADSIVLTEPNEAQNNFQALSEQVDSAIDSEVRKHFGALAITLSNCIDKKNNSVKSVLTEGVRSNNRVTNARQHGKSGAESDVVVNAYILPAVVLILTTT